MPSAPREDMYPDVSLSQLSIFVPYVHLTSKYYILNYYVELRSFPSPQQKSLAVGTKAQRPANVPSHLPAFPDPHTYIRTPVSSMAVNLYCPPRVCVRCVDREGWSRCADFTRLGWWGGGMQSISYLILGGGGGWQNVIYFLLNHDYLHVPNRCSHLQPATTNQSERSWPHRRGTPGKVSPLCWPRRDLLDRWLGRRTLMEYTQVSCSPTCSLHTHC